MRGLSRLLTVVVLMVGACSSADPAADTPTTAPAAMIPPATTAAVTTLPPSTASTTVATTTTTSTTTMSPAELLGVELELVAELPAPPLVMTAPPNDPRLYVAQRDGVVAVIEPTGTVRPEPFIDLTDVVKAGGVEQGLLGLVFHPQYHENGRFYVYYTDTADDTVLAEYIASPDGAVASPTTARQVMFFDQPTDRHNAGALDFGPDGYLYVAVGDGGDGGHNGQKTDTLFGTILRIDVDSGEPYAVPEDNPFVGGGGAAEVWAYGLRNPWRFSIDDETRLMYIGDVGQADWEEIDVVSLDDPGANFGWIYLEGSMCFRAPECRDVPTTLPVVEYPHSEGCSVTGGLVYRGEAIPELAGTYFYSDWCRGWVRSFQYVDGEPIEQQEWPALNAGQVNSFGSDAVGEIYLGMWGGEVYRMVPIRADG